MVVRPDGDLRYKAKGFDHLRPDTYEFNYRGTWHIDDKDHVVLMYEAGCSIWEADSSQCENAADCTAKKIYDFLDPSSVPPRQRGRATPFNFAQAILVVGCILVVAVAIFFCGRYFYNRFSSRNTVTSRYY